ncbi:hypothetical protein BY458DRAFT_519409 [Sporodiniella umbellata]|nr:hypothetical protein BY458DRAFT_519409 [Sporodiniella umbellata]
MNKFFFCWVLFFFYTSQETAAISITGHNGVVVKRKSLPFYGRATHYSTGPGSCGENSTDDEMVVAINQQQMENGVNPNTNPHCDKIIKISGDSGRTYKARIVDTCPQCGEDSLDLSPTCKFYL